MSLPSTVARASWVPIIAALLLLLVLAVSSLLRAHTIPDAIPPLALILTAGLAVALSVRQRAINRELSSDIRVAHQRLGLALEAGKAVAWDWDVKSGRDIWFGDLKTMFGISGDLYEGKVEDFHARVHPDDRERVGQAVAAARRDRAMYNATFRVRWQDGTVRWAAAHGRFYYGADGEPIRMLGIAEDVTERRGIEEKLRQSQEQLAGVVESAMDAIIAIDGDQRIRVFNRAAEHMFGCRAADAIGTTVERFMPRRSRASHRDLVRQFAETGQRDRTRGASGELWGLRADGEEFPIETSISHSGEDSTRLYTVIIRDVTERRRAEAARGETEARFQLMADGAPVFIWLSDSDRRRTYVNRPYLEFTGGALETELGGGWTESVHPEDVKHCVMTYAQAFDRRRSFRMEYRLRRHDGVYRWLLDTGVPRLSADGEFAGYIGSCVDITEEKLAKEALSRLSRRLMESQESERIGLARALHDDLAQRMALLTIELETLSQVLPRPSQTDDVRTRFRALNTHAVELGREIQAISQRLHSFKLEYLGIAVAVEGFCRDVCKQEHVEIEFKSSGIADDLPKDVGLCLLRVLEEALANAVRHAGVAHFKVLLRGTRDEIQLEVIDRGVGFDLDEAMGSHGLGMTSMRERLLLVNGAMAVESRPGAGTTVRARVPLRSPGRDVVLH
ncbi:MAG TPA: PAS domain S-box protein [Vicinamibacterales bacterium]|nr:PAS domain S-box protein [Vicinamibacterales bacterium]